MAIFDFIRQLIIFNFTGYLISACAFGLQCEQISIPACQGLGYNMTALPNLAGHNTQLDAETMITELLPIVESGCSKHIRFLICASLFPLCSPDVPRPVTACKSLCEKVKQDCSTEPILGLLWPKFLHCEILPQPDKQELCMQIPQEEISSEKQNLNPFWPWLPWKLMHISKSITKIICPTNFTAKDDICIAQCNTDALFTSQQRKIADTMILALSTICFVLTLFTLVTFWAEPTRFGYPERPVLFLALCFNLLSVSYLERIVFHNPLKETLNDENNSCTVSSPCLASYITTSYLTICAAFWWFIFTLCYYFSSKKRWSSEALEKKSGLFHVLAWVTPLLPPITALLCGNVKLNKLTRMCTAPGFVEIPTLILLLLGAIFTLLTSKSLVGLQEKLRASNEIQRFTQVRKRIIIFGFIYFIPALLAIILTLFEENDIYVSPCLTAETCEIPVKRSALPTLIKLFLQLAGGTLTGTWVWSRKTCESYRSRLITNGPSVSSVTKTHNFTGKKSKQIPQLYSGISFQHVPIHQGRINI